MRIFCTPPHTAAQSHCLLSPEAPNDSPGDMVLISSKSSGQNSLADLMPAFFFRRQEALPGRNGHAGRSLFPYKRGPVRVFAKFLLDPRYVPLFGQVYLDFRQWRQLSSLI